jgi:hypothetical protein
VDRLVVIVVLVDNTDTLKDVLGDGGETGEVFDGVNTVACPTGVKQDGRG